MRLLIVVRHGESTLNLERRVNGDPTVDVDLTERGREEAHQLGLQVANAPLDLCVHTRFERTHQTAELALAGREIEWREEPLFDDIDVGELEGRSIEDYRAWKREHPRADAFPGGESLDDAARRYARGYAQLLDDPHDTILLVCHEIPLRYALNAAAGSDQLDGPVHELRNAVPYLFDKDAVRRAVERMEMLAAGPSDAGERTRTSKER